MTKISNPGDGRLLDANNYAALDITPDRLRGLMLTAARHGAEIVNASNFDQSGETTDISRDLMHETASAMLATASGERFPLPDGSHELVVLRFVVDGSPLSIVYVEDYAPAYPALVDGHLIDRDGAVAAWLGDTDGSEHPDLFPDAFCV